MDNKNDENIDSKSKVETPQVITAKTNNANENGTPKVVEVKETKEVDKKIVENNEQINRKKNS